MDAHDLFRKLTSGAKFNSKKNPSRIPHVEKSTTPQKLKCELSNTADQWMNFGLSADNTGRNLEAELHGNVNSSQALDNYNSLDDHQSSNYDEEETDSGSDCGTDHSEENSNTREVHQTTVSKSNEGITLLGSIISDVQHVKQNRKKKQKDKMAKKAITPAEKEKLQEEEKANVLRKRLRVSVNGSGVPAPVENFENLKKRYSVSSTLINNLTKAGYSEPTPIQAQAWPIMLMKRQILACAPTGSGKTAAFLLPVLHNLRGLRHDGLKAVVVSPTRELARQTYRECMRLADGTGLRIHIISKVGQLTTKLQSTKKFDVLITTPNRLVYLLKQEPPVLSLKSVEWLIVDESDKLFEAGPRGFRDQLATIYQACDSKNIKRAMFSATHGAHVAKWCKENLMGVIAVTVGLRNTTTDQVDQELVFVGSEQGKLLAMRELITKGLQPPVLIFVQSKERAKELFKEILYDGINVDVIHADRPQLQRDNVVRSFREGKIWVLICTELMGRGIDFKGVNLVINYDFPPSAISYIHRIGRTGRAGRSGKAMTFFTEDDAPCLRSIATVMRDSGCEVPQYMLEMKKVSKRTRRKLENQAPKRDKISTVLISEIRKQERLRRKIENAKRKKKGLPPIQDPPSMKRKAEHVDSSIELPKKKKTGERTADVTHRNSRKNGVPSRKKKKRTT